MQTLLTILITALVLSLVPLFLMIHSLYRIVDEERRYRQAIDGRVALVFSEWWGLRRNVAKRDPVEGRQLIEQFGRHQEWLGQPQRLRRQLLQAGYRFK